MFADDDLLDCITEQLATNVTSAGTVEEVQKLCGWAWLLLCCIILLCTYVNEASINGCSL